MTRNDGAVLRVVPPGQGARVEGLTDRGRRTRALLVQSARRIFERDGFLGARITDIATEANVAHGTFYTYFDSKEAVFREVVLELEADLLGTAVATGDSDPRAAIAAATRHYLEVYRDNSALMMSCEQAASINPEFAQLLKTGKEWFVQRAEKALRRLQDEGLADPHVDAEYAAHALTGMVSRFAHGWISQGEPFELDHAVDQLTLLWANAIGLRSEPGTGRARPTTGTGGTRR